MRAGAGARSDHRRVRSATASKMSDSGAAGSNAVAPFPDIVKQVVFKIEKLTERVLCPKAPTALPRATKCVT